MFGKIKCTVILLAGISGALWVVNLPYPMIRLPIAKAAPILLLPSFISMDYHYRGAIDSLEQADQLVSNATSQADIERGGEKVIAAKHHLNNLPVWFLGYYPRAYCGLFGCRWMFTFDEFEQARQRVARLEAVAFQNKNALTPLNTAQKALEKAKQQYKQATNPQQKKQAITAWRTALNQLEQIPSETLAGKQASTQLAAQKEEFAQVINEGAGSDRINAVIEAAKQFSWQAAKMSQKPPHPVEKWQQIENLWEQSIDRLKQVSTEDITGYAEAQKLMATYEANLSQVKIRRQAEADSMAALEKAQREIENLLASVPKNPQDVDRNSLLSQLQSIINELEKVQNGTTAYPKAQQLLVSAKKKLQELQS
jgi:hypothetical protein